MFSISWIIHCPNLVILGDLNLFLRAGLVKVRNCQKNQKTSKTLFSEPEIQKFIENHRKFQKWKTNYANAQGDIIYMTVQGFGQILSLSIFFDFCSILAIFRADSTILVLFLFFFKQYLVFSIGTGTRDWYRGSSIVF